MIWAASRFSRKYRSNRTETGLVLLLDLRGNNDICFISAPRRPLSPTEGRSWDYLGWVPESRAFARVRLAQSSQYTATSSRCSRMTRATSAVSIPASRSNSSSDLRMFRFTFHLQEFNPKPARECAAHLSGRTRQNSNPQQPREAARRTSRNPGNARSYHPRGRRIHPPVYRASRTTHSVAECDGAASSEQTPLRPPGRQQNLPTCKRISAAPAPSQNSPLQSRWCYHH